MKQLATFLILTLIMGCSNLSAAPEPENIPANLEPFTTVVSTVVPTTVPATAVPTPAVDPTVEGYPAPPQPTIVTDGYPAPATPDTSSAYPVETPEPTATPLVEELGSGLHYIDDVGVWRVTADGLTAQILPLTGASTPVLSSDGAKLAYLLEGEPAIILYDTLTTEITSLSSGSEDFICCVFEWVGDAILAGVQGSEEFGPNIGRLVAISPNNTVTPISSVLIGGYPSFHPTGLRVAYPENGGVQIYDLGGESNPVEISAVTAADGTPLAVENLAFSTASWSPALQYIGWAVSFVQDGEFQLGTAILDLADSSVQIFHPYTAIGTEYLPPRPTWHPSQSLIAFETIDADETQRGVWLVDYATGEEQFILAGSNPTFSPDGAHLAIETATGIQLYALEDGSFTQFPQGRIIDWR